MNLNCPGAPRCGDPAEVRTINAPGRIAVVGMVGRIEHVHPGFEPHVFPNRKALADCKVYVPQSRSAANHERRISGPDRHFGNCADGHLCKCRDVQILARRAVVVQIHVLDVEDIRTAGRAARA